MLSNISREPRELPWQPNLGKNKPKMHRNHFCARNRELFRTNSKVFGVGDFKYAIQNFKGAKGVAMATKFRQK